MIRDEDQFIQDLDIEKLDFEDLLSIFDVNEKREGFLSSKNNEWFRAFYTSLFTAIEIDERRRYSEKVWLLNKAKKTSIIKSSSDGSIVFLKASEVHLSIADAISPSNEIAVVIPEVYHPKNNGEKEKLDCETVEKFLHLVGVKEFDAEEEFDRIFTNYNKNMKIISLEEHMTHIRYYMECYKNNPSFTVEFFPCLLVENSDNQLSWKPLKEIYLDEPYKKTGFNVVADIVEYFPLSSHYIENLDNSSIECFLEILEQKGVVFELVVTPTDVFRNKKIKYVSSYMNEHKIKEDYTIGSLTDLLIENRIDVNLFIWKAITSAPKKCKYARFRKNLSDTIQTVESQLVQLLSDVDWIPNNEGVMYNPKDIFEPELHSDFLFDDSNGVLSAIGFGKNRKRETEREKIEKEFLEELRIDKTDLEDLKRTSEETGVPIKELLKTAVTKAHKQRRPPSFPENISPNPERRDKAIQNEYKNAPLKIYEKRERSVPISSPDGDKKMYLRNMYTNEDEEMVCQICKDEMPFKKREGEYYFEGVEIFNKEDLDNKHEAQYIALCPLCTAKYKEFVKRKRVELINFEDNIRNFQFDTDCSDFSIPISLDVEGSVRFVEKHLRDIIAILSLKDISDAGNE